MPSMLTRILAAILEAVDATRDDGVPDGPLYMMLQSLLGSAWSLDVHTKVIAGMVMEGLLTNTHDVLRVTEKGRKLLKAGGVW